MTATLTFTLPEESGEHMRAVRAGEMAYALIETNEAMRMWLKLGHGFKTPDEAIEKIWEMLADAVRIAGGEV